MTDKIYVYSGYNGTVVIKNDELHINRTLPKEGSKMGFTMDQLSELVDDLGFRYMLEQGIIYIEDMKAKKELGLEPEDAEEPKNLIVLKAADIKKLFATTCTVKKFRETLESVSRTQCEKVADYAIEHSIIDAQKTAILEELTGKNILTAIALQRKAQEED